MHLFRWKRYGSTNADDAQAAYGTFEERFWRHVDKRSPNECWVWKGSLGTRGYGRLNKEGGKGAGSVGAHQASYILHFGSIPKGVQIHHKCENPPCVNPNHLEALTPREHLLKGNTFQAKNAAKTHCIHGHEFTPENTLPRKTKTGTIARLCKQCQHLKYLRKTEGVVAKRRGAL